MDNNDLEVETKIRVIVAKSSSILARVLLDIEKNDCEEKSYYFLKGTVCGISGVLQEIVNRFPFILEHNLGTDILLKMAEDFINNNKDKNEH